MRALVPLIAVFAVGCATTGAPPSVTGIWTGALGIDTAKPLGVQFVLEEKDGQLTGTTAFLDTQNPDALPVDGTIKGSRDGAAASWTSETDIVVRGTFDGDTFVGTLQFPPEEGRSSPPSPLKLKRSAVRVQAR